MFRQQRTQQLINMAVCPPAVTQADEHITVSSVSHNIWRENIEKSPDTK